MLFSLLLLLGCQIKDIRYYHDEAVRFEKEGEFNKALNAYKEALKLDENHFSSLYNSANLYYLNKNYKQARVHFIKAIIERTNFAQAYYSLGLTYMQLKERAKGYEAFRQALLHKPGLIDVYLAQAYFRLEDDQAEQALKPLQSASQLTNADFRVFFNLGLVNLQLARYSNAIMALTNAIQRNPTNLEARILTARAWLGMGKQAAVKSILDQLLQEAPNNLHVALLQANYNLSIQNWADAKRDLIVLNQRYPDSYQAAFLLGRFYQERKQYKAALAAFRRASNIEFKRKEPKLEMARIYLALKQPRKARALLVQLYKYYQDDRDVLENLMVIYYRQGYFDRAIVIGDKLLALQKDNISAQIHTGLSYLRVEDDSLRDLKKGVALLWPRRLDKPRNRFLLRYLKQALLELKDKKRAREVEKILGSN